MKKNIQKKSPLKNSRRPKRAEARGAYARLIQEKKLPSGAKLLTARFGAHDCVSVVGSVSGGSQLASAFLNIKDGTGSGEFAKVHAGMLLEGTRSHDKKELQILLDDIGAALSFEATHARLVFSGKVRARHLATFLDVITEVLTEPSFPERELEIFKQRELANLAFEAQDTRIQASIALSRLLYLAGHPNFNETTSESREMLEGTTAPRLADFHRQILDGSSLIFSVAGDIAPARAFSLAEKHFKKLPRSAVLSQLAFEKAPAQNRQTAVVHIEHKANIDYLAGIATALTDTASDYPALLLGVQILGNHGFTGRLMQIVREKKGLTYGAYATCAGADSVTDGYISVWATFAPELFAKGREAIWLEIKKIASNGASAEEVRKHRERFEAHFRTQLSDSSAFARAAHGLAVEGRSMSYLDEFPKRIRALKAQEVNAALKTYLVPKKFSEAAAGLVDEVSLK